MENFVEEQQVAPIIPMPILTAGTLEAPASASAIAPQLNQQVITNQQAGGENNLVLPPHIPIAAAAQPPPATASLVGLSPAQIIRMRGGKVPPGSTGECVR